MSILADGRGLVRGLLLVAVSFGGDPGFASEIPDHLRGRPVEAIRFDSSVEIDERDFRYHMPLRVGDPLEDPALRASIDWLRDKEIFSSIDPRIEAVRQGAEVTFRLAPAEVVVGVDVRGVTAVDPSEILRRARIREDERLPEVRAAAAIERIRDLYADLGYPDSSAEITRESVRPGRIRAIVHVSEGQPIILDELAILGIPEREEEGARRALGFSEGDVFRGTLPAQAREALIRHSREQGYFEADVREYHEVLERRAFLQLELRKGPRFELRVDGVADPVEDVIDLEALRRRPIITDGTWRLLGRRVEENRRELGYPFAEVSVLIEEQIPKRVTFHVMEGPRVRIGAVRFEGNEGLGTDELIDGVESLRGDRSFPFPQEEPWLREERLADDARGIVEKYRAAGYERAAVVEIRRTYSPDRTQATVVFAIEEGKRTVVESLEVLDEEGLLPDPTKGLRLRAGDPLNPSLLETDRRALITRLTASGHPDAEVTVLAEPVRQERGQQFVRLRYRLHPGPLVRVGRIIIQHNYFTRDRVIRRELPFESGDPLDPALLLEAQRSIYRLGLFRSVSVQPAVREGTERDVIVRLVERPGGELKYGFGYNTRAGLRTFGEIGHRNLLGTGRPMSLRTELNLAPDNLVPDEYRIGFEAREPRVVGSLYDLRTNLLYLRSERSVDEFSIRRFSFSTGFEREFLAGLQASTLLEFEDSRVFDVAPDAVLTGQDVGRLRIVSLNPILVYDGRDDAFAPTRGVFDTVRFRYGAPALGSDVHFVKLNLQHSQYVPLFRSWTLLYAARAGIAEPLGSSATIPLRERFFLGGRTSVRGFDENGVGPRGENGSPVGGDLSLSGNVELRFPLLWGLGGAVFVDGGGLYLRDREVSIREFRESAGPGLRYLTPVGAISLDYGFKLDRRNGESAGEVHFTIGNIF